MAYFMNGWVTDSNSLSVDKINALVYDSHDISDSDVVAIVEDARAPMGGGLISPNVRAAKDAVYEVESDLLGLVFPLQYPTGVSSSWRAKFSSDFRVAADACEAIRVPGLNSVLLSSI